MKQFKLTVVTVVTTKREIIVEASNDYQLAKVLQSCDYSDSAKFIETLTAKNVKISDYGKPRTVDFKLNCDF